jgi:hypothetical protein
MDIIWVAFIGAVLLITIIFAYVIWSAINTNIQGSEAFDTGSKAISQVTTDKLNGTMDAFFILIWFAFYLFALISAWFIDTHPIFFFLSIFVLVIILVALTPLVKATQEMLTSDVILASSWTSQFPIMAFCVQNFFAIIVAQAMLLVIIMYAKTRSQ